MEYIDNPIGNDGSEEDAEYSPSAPFTNHSIQLEHTAGSHDKLSNEGSATSRQDSKNQNVSPCRLPSFNTIRPLYNQQIRRAATIHKAMINSETQFSNDFNYGKIFFNIPSEPTSTLTDKEETSSILESNDKHLRKSRILDSRMAGVCGETPQVDDNSLFLNTSHAVPEANTENLSHEINQTNIETTASQRLLPSQFISLCGKRNKSDYFKKLHLLSVAFRSLELQNQLTSSNMNEIFVNITDSVIKKDANTEPMSQTFNDNADANLALIEIESERRLDTDIIYTKQQTNSLLPGYDPQTNSGGNRPTHNHGASESSYLFLQSASTFKPRQKASHVSHVGSHLVEEHNKCHVCHKSFSQQSALNEHDCMHAIGKPYTIAHCDKTLRPNCPTERNHSGEKPYKCKACGKSFCQKAHLVTHELIHSGEKPYECKTCGKSFNQSMNLKRHERIHSGEKPYECKTCGKSFCQKANLVTHELIHSGEKPYECKTCGKSFCRKYNLVTHERIHSGEKPYKCKTCGKSFCQKANLVTHELIHSGENPYECKTCGKSFNQSKNLKRHEQIHSGEKPFECQHCGKSFTLKQSLKRHIFMHAEQNSCNDP